MSVIDTIVGAIAPEENENAHREARAKAKMVARPGDWLSLVLAHHEAIEAAFAAVKTSTAAARTTAQKRLAVLLTGHANAEESVIYPAMARLGGKANATMAYSEQATAKTEMADLEMLPPMSQEYLERLEHIRDAVAHHMYHEENTWFADLKATTSAEDQVTLARRYQEEFDRYVGGDEGHASVGSTKSAAEITMQRRLADPALGFGVPRD